MENISQQLKDTFHLLNTQIDNIKNSKRVYRGAKLLRLYIEIMTSAKCHYTNKDLIKIVKQLKDENI